MKLIKFETSHCPMCKALEISIKKLNLDVIHVDCESDDAQVDYFEIKSVPTLVMIDDAGYEIKRTGYIGMLELRDWVK